MKRILTIALLAIGLVATVSAQAPAASPIEMKYFTIESSIVAGYSIASENATAGSSFLLNFAVADNFTLGVQTMKLEGANSINSMKLGYYLNDMLGFSATFGAAKIGTAAPFTYVSYYGAGAFVNLKKNVREDGLSDAIKLRLEYIFPETGFGDGAILMSAGFCLGL